MDCRWKSGWLGLDPDMDLAWPLENGAPELEFDLFIAEDG
jgi:hypothetical protein